MKRCGNDTSIRCPCSTITTSKYSPTETRPRQWNIRKHEKTHQRKIQIRIGNGTAGVPLMKRSQSSHPQFQIPISTPPMGQTTPTNRNYPKPTATIECNIHGFSIRTLIWTIRLQQDAISPNGLRSTNPRKKTDKRGTWSYHSVDGWYLSTSPEHYRVHNCYVKTTQVERLTDTIQFKHKNITNPTISSHDKIMQA